MDAVGRRRQPAQSMVSVQGSRPGWTVATVHTPAGRSIWLRNSTAWARWIPPAFVHTAKAEDCIRSRPKQK